MMKKISLTAKILFAVYCILMIWLLFIQRMPIEFPEPENYIKTLVDRINIIPFKTISVYLNNVKWSDIFFISSAGNALVNLAGNIIMFVPMGFFMCCIWKKMRNFLRHFLATFITILLIELIQLFTFLGSFDIDDLILNIIGSVIGFLTWFIFTKVFHTKKESPNRTFKSNNV